MHPRPTDRQGLEVLDPETCLHLLDLSPVGRVAFVHAGEPVVLPVNHLRDGRSVVFRTASGITLDAAGRRASMAFEVDGYDEDTRTGWSVLLRGTSDLETDDDTLARLDQENLHPWADDIDRPHWVRLRATRDLRPPHPRPSTPAARSVIRWATTPIMRPSTGSRRSRPSDSEVVV